LQRRANDDCTEDIITSFHTGKKGGEKVKGESRDIKSAACRLRVKVCYYTIFYLKTNLEIDKRNIPFRYMGVVHDDNFATKACIQDIVLDLIIFLYTCTVGRRT
jgi:hypothetical protein